MYDVQDHQRGMYAPRINEFAEMGKQAGWTPSDNDKNTERIALVIVDMQYDFVSPDGNLSVPGSLGDLQRLCEFIYAQGNRITTIIASLDSHMMYHIFFKKWWMYVDNGQNPGDYTLITLNAKNEAVDPDGRVLVPLIEPMWSMQYLAKLRAGGKKSLMIWPYHTMVGTMGHALMPSLSEALAFHSSARLSQVQYLQKAEPTRTEFYAIWGAEVPDPKDPRTQLNTAVLDVVASHDKVYVAGEAKSHCVLETMNMMFDYFGQNNRAMLKKHRFLMDAMSSVQHPLVDFESIANAQIADLERQGAVLVKTTDPIG